MRVSDTFAHGNADDARPNRHQQRVAERTELRERYYRALHDLSYRDPVAHLGYCASRAVEAGIDADTFQQHYTSGKYASASQHWNERKKNGSRVLGRDAPERFHAKAAADHAYRHDPNERRVKLAAIRDHLRAASFRAYYAAPCSDRGKRSQRSNPCPHATVCKCRVRGDSLRRFMLAMLDDAIAMGSGRIPFSHARAERVVGTNTVAKCFAAARAMGWIENAPGTRRTCDAMGSRTAAMVYRIVESELRSGVQSCSSSANRDGDGPRPTPAALLHALASHLVFQPGGLHFDVLCELLATPEPRTASELAAPLRVHRTTVTRHLRKLERVGLATCDNDGWRITRPPMEADLDAAARALGIAEKVQRRETRIYEKRADYVVHVTVKTAKSIGATPVTYCTLPTPDTPAATVARIVDSRSGEVVAERTVRAPSHAVNSSTQPDTATVETLSVRPSPTMERSTTDTVD